MSDDETRWVIQRAEATPINARLSSGTLQYEVANNGRLRWFQWASVPNAQAAEEKFAREGYEIVERS